MNQRWVVGTVAAVIVVASWLGRYEMVGIGVGDYPPTVFRLDRWTGKMMAAQPSGTKTLEPIDQEPVKTPLAPQENRWWESAPLVDESAPAPSGR